MGDLTALVLRAREGDADAFSALVRRFQDYAAGLGLIELISHLIVHGADINTPDSEGRTPLGVAITEKRVEAAELLRREGAQE